MIRTSKLLLGLFLFLGIFGCSSPYNPSYRFEVVEKKVAGIDSLQQQIFYVMDRKSGKICVSYITPTNRETDSTCLKNGFAK